MKRRQTLRYLHELRSITHIIDMHQLTKDQSFVRGEEQPDISDKPPMTRAQLIRYFDYCSEMFSLTSKLAALCATFS